MSYSNPKQRKPRLSTSICATALAFSMLTYVPVGYGNDEPDRAGDRVKTASPIKHVIIIVGENRSFDHIFATYVPNHRGERVLNLLSEGIVNADGSPGPNFAKAHQFQITSAPNGGKFFSSAGSANKQLYPTLPPPDLAGVGPVSPAIGILSLPGGDPGLPPQDQFLFGTGGSGLGVALGPDTRITNVNNLPPGPFQLTGPAMPFDAYTGDTIHQYFQMVQQVDCAIDAEHVSKDNPTGCLHDLQSAVTTTYRTPPGGTPHDTGQTMAFFNVQNGDAPLFKSLADTYTMSDNYHQPVHGGTGPDSEPLGFADQIFFSDGNGNPTMPPANRIYNPDPAPGTLNLYTHRAQWFNCNDQAQPGIAAITNYLNALPYKVSTNCGPGQYFQAVNVNPAFTPKGTLQSGLVVPPTTQKSISYVKPDGALDGHPASSKWGLFEAFAKNIIELAQTNPKQWAETAIFVTVDEGGGYYDSGFIQPVDFFGTGPRIPMIAVSPFSKGGHISHVYNEHSSFVKFIERNWMLNTTLSDRSRDNLPNPRLRDDNPYIPSNMPAIGDLFDLFNFGNGQD